MRMACTYRDTISAIAGVAEETGLKERTLKAGFRNLHRTVVLIFLLALGILSLGLNLLCIPASSQTAKGAHEITVAAAADLSTALKEVADNYEKKSGTKVKLSFGASGALTQQGENIAQAAQFVESGNAQVGFVALAHAASPAMQGKGKYWEVPAQAYPALKQGVVLLAHSKHKKEAESFLHYVKTKEAGDVLRKYGFTLP
jgi:ABC-type molybdate transport system substrate-binding protein